MVYMEKLARAQYLKNKITKDCALLYIALNKVQLFAGIFKISKDEKDKPLVGFLSRNFQVNYLTNLQQQCFHNVLLFINVIKHLLTYIRLIE